MKAVIKKLTVEENGVKTADGKYNKNGKLVESKFDVLIRDLDRSVFEDLISKAVPEPYLPSMSSEPSLPSRYLNISSWIAITSSSFEPSRSLTDIRRFATVALILLPSILTSLLL